MLGSQLYNDELHHFSKNNWHENKNMAINKLRLPRKLLEKWVEEPFFDTAVVGCFVRLGVGKAPGLRCEPQYKVCEIIGVGEYKHSYALGEFQTKKALLLRIGRNTRLWRMNVISNHRF
jgi:RNA polymerase-associated protein RTF1